MGQLRHSGTIHSLNLPRHVRLCQDYAQLEVLFGGLPLFNALEDLAEEELFCECQKIENIFFNKKNSNNTKCLIKSKNAKLLVKANSTFP